MKEIIKEQESTLKNEVSRLIEKTQQGERDKERLVEELRNLREELAKQQDERYEIDWQNLSRAAHWTNSAINQYGQLNLARRKVISSEVKLKTTINQGDYFGPILPSGVDAGLPPSLLVLKEKQGNKPLF